MSKESSIKMVIILSVVLFLIILYSATASLIFSQDKDEKARLTREEKLKEYPVPKSATELELKWSFPKEAEAANAVFLHKPRYLAMDSEDNVYVTDEAEHRIAKFDYKGKFIKYLGRPGQGPGDLMIPLVLSIDKNNVLMVWETGNMRFQLLDAEGKYISFIKMFKGYLSWANGDNNEIYTIPRILPADKNLIEVINREGVLIGGFGRPIEFKFGGPIYNEAEIRRGVDGKIYVAFRYMDIIRIYNEQGNLLNEIHPDNKLFKDNEKYNIENQENYLKKERASFKTVMNSICVLKDHLFILNGYPRIEIMEYDSTGKLISFYWFKKDYTYLVQNFEVRKIDNRIYFFILQNFPEATIEVYSPIEKLR